MKQLKRMLLGIGWFLCQSFFLQAQISDQVVWEGFDTLVVPATTYRASTGNFSRADNDWVELNALATPLENTNRSVFMWIRRTASLSETEVLFAVNTSAGGNISNLQISTSGELSIFEGSSTVSSNVVVADGDWHHVGYTYDESSNLTTFYVDGVNVNSFSSGQSITATSQVSLGQEFDNAATSNHYDGEMTEVSVWNELLDATDIAKIMTSKIENTHPKYANLKGYYPFDYRTPTNITTLLTDYSGNSHNGVLSADDIPQSFGTGTTIPNFNSAGWYTKNWRNPSNTTISTDDTLRTTSFVAGQYSIILTRSGIMPSYTFNVTVKKPFTTTWQTTTPNESITIPTTGTGYNYAVNWGDGTIETGLTGDATHTYATAGTYTVSVGRDFPRIYFNGAGDREKIKSIEQWGDISWSSMEDAFRSCTFLVSNATDAPDLSSVTSFVEMFRSATAFNGDLSNWQTDNVVNMSRAFQLATSFNGDISTWNVQNVTNFSNMFRLATAFDADISGWSINNTANVTMSSMLSGASAFNYNLGNWNMSNVTGATLMLANSGMSTANYDATLAGWSTQTLKTNVFFGADGLTYCVAETERQKIIDDFGWTISGDSKDCTGVDFITTWQTTTPSESITIPTTGSGYDYRIDWGDGTIETGKTGNAMHTYATAGTYTVSIRGDFPRIYFNNTGDRDKIMTIQQWGSIAWTSMRSAFTGCSQLTYNATDNPDLSLVTDMYRMFRQATAFDGDLNSWNTEKVENMAQMFLFASSFNGDISSWKVDKVTDMSFMFREAILFNQDISGWNVELVQNMGDLFANADAFNQDISSWDVGNVSNMASMFSSNGAFDQDLGSWDMKSVTNASSMFNSSQISTTNYDKILIGWSAQTLQNNVTFRSSARYCNAGTERQKIIDDFGWTITDPGIASGCPTTTDIIWNGTAWSPNAPTATDNATIDGNYSVAAEGDFTCANLTINSGNTLTIEAVGVVTVTGNLVNAGIISVKNNGAFVQTSATPTNSGSGTYTSERLAPNYLAHYSYWSSPVVNATINDIFGSTGRNFYTHNAIIQNWAVANVNATLNPADAFIATGTSGTPTSITRSFSGIEGFHSGNISTPLTFNVDADADNDWNLVGNPYPSGLDAATFISDNSSVIGSAIYLWSSDGNDYSSAQSDYATMNAAGVVNAGGGTPPTSATVASGQGFMVQATANSNLNFANSQRVGTNNTFLKTKSDEWQRVWLGIELDGKHSNELLIGFMPDAEEGKDLYDAHKLSAHAHLSFYSFQKQEQMAIQGFPTLTEDRVIPIGLEAKTAGEYKFHINHLVDFAEENEVYLYDAETNLLTNLKEADYALNLEVGKYDNRFSLRFIAAKVTGIEDDLELKGIAVYASNQQLHISFADAPSAKANISVYDISGRLLVAQSVENQLAVKIPVQYHGICIVRIENARGVVSRRVYLD